MESTYLWLFVTLLTAWVVAVTILFFMGRNIRKHVEESLKNASTEEQDIIRNKLVKAMFPPKFPKE